MSNNRVWDSIGNVNEKYLLETMPENYDDSHMKNRHTLKKSLGIVAACFVFIVITLAGICISSPVYARNLPLVGSTFAYIQDNLDIAGVYSNYAFDIGDQATDNGITITMSEAYCDGVNFYVSFIIESDQPFSSMTSDPYLKEQLNYYGEGYIVTDSGQKKLNDPGTAGFEGEFTDEYTFVGIETFSLDGQNFPDNFEFNMSIESVGLMTDKIYKTMVSGNWKFAAGIAVNTEDTKVYEINKEVNGYTIDKVVVTPIMITVYTSYPDVYGDTVDYWVETYSDISPNEGVACQGVYDATTGITQIPTSRVNHELFIYVMDRECFDDNEKITGSQEQMSQHAILSAVVNVE